MSRAERLNERFLLIQQTLTELHGKPLAFAAASAAWLRAIQYGVKQSLEGVKQFTGLDDVAYTAAGEAVEKYDLEHELMLRVYHKELCVHLNVDPAQALELSLSFEQVVQDICFQGG